VQSILFPVGLPAPLLGFEVDGEHVSEKFREVLPGEVIGAPDLIVPEESLREDIPGDFEVFLGHLVAPIWQINNLLHLIIYYD
jgi:hypothetical protein